MSSRQSNNYSVANNNSVSSDYVNANDEESALHAARTATVAGVEEGLDPSTSRGNGQNAFQNEHNIIHNGSGFRRLHRDYLNDLDDDIVMSMPWSNPTESRNVSELLWRRMKARRLATHTTVLVMAYFFLVILYWILLQGMILIAEWMILCQVFASMILLVSLLYVHYRYYKLDVQVQSLVRAVMDANGLGVQDMHGTDMLRTEPSQQAQFMLPEFVNVMLRSAAADDTDNFSVVTFRESWICSSKQSSSATSCQNYSMSNIFGTN